MCGICGVVPLRKDSVGDLAHNRVSKMVNALAHRGPDDSAVIEQNAAALGATRLAIRGLGSGRQPIVDPASGIVTVCNGEIDNHRDLRRWLAQRGGHVAEDTDIAVIPHLYKELGEDFVERLQGVFAIAVWDARRERLLLARDRAGERPLYFTVSGNVVRFATELAALALDRESELDVDQKAVSEFLRIGCIVSPKTPFASISKVSPGEIVMIDGDGVWRRRYWKWNICGAAKRRGDTAEFDRVFRDAVRRQTDVDVPFGVFLSGGLDSSLAAAVLRDLRPDALIRAYSLRFREPSYDEGDAAESVAKDLGLESHTVWVEPKQFPSMIRMLLRRVGEPLADPAWVPTALLAERAAREVKLVLGGEGGDELFGGYPTYIAGNLAERYARLPKLFRRFFEAAVSAWPESERKVTLSFLLKRFVQSASRLPLERHMEWKASGAPATLQSLGIFADKNSTGGVLSKSLLDDLQRADFETTLAEGLLTKADRAGMASGLEVRSPFLDQHVMEFAATLPPRERVAGFVTKRFLKNYAAKYLPRSVISQRKRGLSVPLATWLRGPLAQWAHDRLTTSRLERVGISRGSIAQILDEHARRKSDHARLIWTFIVLAEWLDWLNEVTAARRTPEKLLAQDRSFDDVACHETLVRTAAAAPD